MKSIRILRPEDIVIHQTMVSGIDPQEAEESFQKAIEATERLRHFVENRERGLFPDIDTRAKRPLRRIGFGKRA